MSASQSFSCPTDLLKALQWRYAVKQFDPARKIPDDVWKILEETLVLSPSSYGMQPWRFYVVTDQAVKEKLVAPSFRQKQVVDASHVVVLAIKKDIGAVDVERFIRRTAEVRGVPLESLDGFRKMLLGFVSRTGDLDEWATRQVYIALGTFMTAAAVIGVDTCPMEGLMPAQYDDILGIAKDGYSTVLACPAGYRSAADKYASVKKVRYKTDDVIKRI